MASQVSTRGQITIDRDVREALSIKPGMIAVQSVVDDHLEVYFVPAPHRESLFGVLPLQEPISADYWEEIRARAADAIAAGALRAP
jgi:bifunctional DNA-binding transcriptional regulator/antitoxin component of YhaV-PrlF toxin-antitoxin module